MSTTLTNVRSSGSKNLTHVIINMAITSLKVVLAIPSKHDVNFPKRSREISTVLVESLHQKRVQN